MNLNETYIVVTLIKKIIIGSVISMDRDLAPKETWWSTWDVLGTYETSQGLHQTSLTRRRSETYRTSQIRD